MNDYVARLREKYDDYFGCVPGIVLDCRGLWRHCVTVPETAVFGYYLGSDRRLHYVVITIGMSQAQAHFAPYMGSVRQPSELICYLDILDDEGLCHLQWLTDPPFHERLALDHGHSVASGFLLYEYNLLRHFLLPPTPLGEDATLLNGFNLSAHSVNLLQVMPLTEQEYRVKVNKYLEGIAKMLNDAGYPLSLDRHRHCYVTG